MKKYIIITYDVCNMGGGQLFVLRRANHLEMLGYEVHIVVTYHSEYFPLKDKFKGIPLYIIPEMGEPVVKTPKKKSEKIICELLSKVGTSSDLMIESHTLPTIEWGELIASKYGARHLAYPLAEPQAFAYRFKPGIKIFENKLKYGQFYGCSSTSLKEIFGRDDVPANYINIGYDDSELYEKCSPALGISRVDGTYIITTVTRLDKTYVEPLVLDTVKLAQKFPNQQFVLLIAGGSKTPGREEYLLKNFSNQKFKQKNLQIVYKGYIEKLGKDIFEITDLFVGMGTAVINAISQKCITLNIDPRDNMLYSSGFFGVDTNNFAYSESGKRFTIFEKLEEAYLMSPVEKNETSIIGRALFEREFENRACMEKLDSVICSLAKTSENNIPYVSCLYRSYVCTGVLIKRVLRKLHR